MSALLVLLLSQAQVPAFPGAEGFGAKTRGGRGGKVLLVTTLDDYKPGKEPIPGSLRWACEQEGPRTVVFRVGGIIDLKASLSIRKAFLTIAGQSAPGDGICLRGYGVSVAADEVVLRHLRIRPGDVAGKEVDSLSVLRARNVVIDQCSASWSVDETLSVTGEGCTNVTVQWCMITESLNRSVHAKGEHGYGSLLRADGKLTFHHNLYAHHTTRCPRPGTYGKEPGLLLDFRNNVIYDWSSPAGYTSKDSARLNYVGNYLKPGPSTRDREHAFKIGGPATRMFVDGNVLAGREGDAWSIIRGATEENRLAAALECDAVRTDSAEEAFGRVLERAGALRPARDAVDRRIVEEVRTGTGRIIDSPKDAGGWPEYRGAEAPEDGDADGMPSEWERRHGLDPARADDAGDLDRDGYTNLEEWLNGTDPART